MANDLPVELWTLVMRHVDGVADRLRCAGASQRLHAAAAAATDSLELSFSPYERTRREAFDGYLSKHGSCLTHLKMTRAGVGQQLFADLPCAQLKSLDLLGYVNFSVNVPCVVQLGPGRTRSSLPGVLSSSSRTLTYLKLSDCRLASAGDISSLYRHICLLSELQHLELKDVAGPEAVGGKQQGGSSMHLTLPGSVLCSLPHLTHVKLTHCRGHPVHLDNLHHVSSLAALAVLCLQLPWGDEPTAYPRLAPDISPGFVLPASLRELYVSGGIRLTPAVLCSVPQLVVLELHGGIDSEGQQPGQLVGAALLEALAGMTKLERLHLSSNLPAEAWPPAGAVYSGLTASTQLRELEVSCRRGRRVPEEAWLHVFPLTGNGRLSALTKLRVLDDSFKGLDAVSRIVGNCPSLVQLHMYIQPFAPVLALQALSALTRLDVYVRCDGVSATQVINDFAGFTNLRVLNLYPWSTILGGYQSTPRHALLPLTCLRQLQWGNVGGHPSTYTTVSWHYELCWVV